MSADEFKNKGNDAFKAGRYQDAIDWYTKAIDLDPASESSGALYSNRAASWIGLKKYENALEDADRCIRVRPSWLKGYFRRGVSLLHLERLDEAQKAFQEALQYEANSADIQEKLQEVNIKLRQRNERATPASCKDPEQAKILGNSLFGQGKYDLAVTFYTRAIELASSTGVGSAEKANYYANRAACHQQTHNYNAVIQDCNEALGIDSKHVKALLRRAIAYEGLERWQKALDDYNMVNQLSPGMSNVSQGVLRCQRAIRAC